MSKKISVILQTVKSH